MTQWVSNKARASSEPEILVVGLGPENRMELFFYHSLHWKYLWQEKPVCSQVFLNYADC